MTMLGLFAIQHNTWLGVEIEDIVYESLPGVLSIVYESSEYELLF